MRRFIWLATALVALAAAGLAVAHGFDGVKAVKSVSGTFTATTASPDNKTRTCTNADGTFAFTKGEYAGTATGSDPDLTGPIKLQVSAAINTTKDLGTLDGKLRIDTASGKDTVAEFNAVYANGKINGLAAGRAHEPLERLVGNISAKFSPTGGFTDGAIGNTAAGGAAVELARGKCEPAQAGAKPSSRAEGAISALSKDSITVAGLTCAVSASLAGAVADLKVGDPVEIRCAVVGGVNTLVKIEKKKKKKD